MSTTVRPSHERIAAILAGEHRVDVEADPNEALFRAADGNYDLLIVSLALENFDALRLCSQVRSLDRTREHAYSPPLPNRTAMRAWCGVWKSG